MDEKTIRMSSLSDALEVAKLYAGAAAKQGPYIESVLENVYEKLVEIRLEIQKKG